MKVTIFNEFIFRITLTSIVNNIKQRRDDLKANYLKKRNFTISIMSHTVTL